MGVYNVVIKATIVVMALMSTIRQTDCQGRAEKYNKLSKYQPCRPFVGFSRCVDEPLNPRAENPWCSYHVCGESFVAAKRCERKDKKATHYCIRETVKKDVYECKVGKKHKRIKLPLGCHMKKGECTGWARACACRKVAIKRKVYTKYRKAVFKCFTRRYGKVAVKKRA